MLARGEARRRAAVLDAARVPDSWHRSRSPTSSPRASASRGGIYESPCVESIPLSQLTGAHIYCKLDYLQRTGSFKERGARNALLQLTADAAQARRDRRVGRQSRAGHRLSRQPARHSGDRRDAEVRAADQGHQLPPARRARRAARRRPRPRRARKPKRSPRAKASRSSIRSTTRDVIAGQGTMALEILEQTPDVEAIVVPVGGGGLLAGIGTVDRRRCKPDVERGRRRARARSVPHRGAGRRARR